MNRYLCPKCGSSDLNQKTEYVYKCSSCNYTNNELYFKVLNPEDLKFKLVVGYMYLTRKGDIVKINEFDEYFLGSNGVTYNYKGHDIRDNSDNDLIQEY